MRHLTWGYLGILLGCTIFLNIKFWVKFDKLADFKIKDWGVKLRHEFLGGYGVGDWGWDWGLGLC